MVAVSVLSQADSVPLAAVAPVAAVRPVVPAPALVVAVRAQLRPWSKLRLPLRLRPMPRVAVKAPEPAEAAAPAEAAVMLAARWPRSSMPLVPAAVARAVKVPVVSRARLLRLWTPLPAEMQPAVVQVELAPEQVVPVEPVRAVPVPVELAAAELVQVERVPVVAAVRVPAVLVLPACLSWTLQVLRSRMPPVRPSSMRRLPR